MGATAGPYASPGPTTGPYAIRSSRPALDRVAPCARLQREARPLPDADNADEWRQHVARCALECLEHLLLPAHQQGEQFRQQTLAAQVRANVAFQRRWWPVRAWLRLRDRQPATWRGGRR